jgi:signal transduction histidine kinase
MLSRSTSPLPNQQPGNETSISSQIVFRSDLTRKLPGTSRVRHDKTPSREQCDGVSSLQIDNEVRWGASDPTLLGIAAHDLRHPASALLIYSELLTEAVGPALNAEQKELIDSIHSASEFMLRLLDDTLDLATMGSGTLQLRAVPAILKVIVANSLSMSLPLAARKHTQLALSEDGEPRTVLLDPVKMIKVFNNLIENAIKYSQPGARIGVQISRDHGRVMVSVQDDGPGISPSDLKTLFTPFQRTRARALSGEPGTGLGLAIAKQIVELHEGQIWVETEVGRGTTFYVSLPTEA